MKILKFILVVLVCAGPVCSFAQICDSILTKHDSIKVVRFSIQKIDSTVYPERDEVNMDTSLNYFQHNDPIKKVYFFNANAGNTGLASHNLVFSKSAVTGFSYGIHAFDPYMTAGGDKNFYFSLVPFTDLFYTIGTKKEHIFHVTHLHSIKNKVFLGVNYQIVGAPGRDRFQQAASDHSVSVFSFYRTTNKRYGVYVNYIYNRIKVQENGGLQNDTIYLNYRKGFSTASPSYFLLAGGNKLKESAVVLKQYYSFERDSADRKNDSVPAAKSYNYGRLIHTFSFKKLSQRFTDAELNGGYFPIIPFDTGYCADSVMFYAIENSLEWTNTELRRDNTPRRVRYVAKITHAYTEVHQMNGNYFINVLKPALGLTAMPYRTLAVGVNAEWVLFDIYKNDFLVQASAVQKFEKAGKSFGTIELKGAFSKTRPDWFLEHYYSKYYQWDFDWLKQQIAYVGFNYSYKRLSVGVDYYNLYNHVYMDANARPKQFVGGYIQVFSAYVSKNFVMGKFEIDTKVAYQFNDKNALLRTPQLVAMQSYFFGTHLFKKALFAQLGVDLMYNTRYYADAYNPALRSFYLQNQAQVGNYLFADVFLNFKVKRLRAYVKLCNFLSGVIGYDNFTVPHYPMQDRTFNFGVGWLFHD
ncbi:MAG: putative porin [Bacteroidota bacterium]